MLREFQNISHFSISMGDVFLNIFIAFLCGVLIAFFYKVTYRGPGYTVAFLNSLIVLSMITAIVIIVNCVAFVRIHLIKLKLIIFTNSKVNVDDDVPVC